MKASIIVGLGFGDEGKGITTDFLVRDDPENSVVIRYSGGQQAGHCVMTNGQKHVHSNFGSGTMRSVPTYFSEHTTVYLNGIANERLVLQGKGYTPDLAIHPLAKMTTPYDVHFARMQEKVNRHGSVGLGIGATMKRNKETGYKLYAMDTLYPDVMNERLLAIRNYYFNQLPLPQQYEFETICKDDIHDFIINMENSKNLFKIHTYEYLNKFQNLIFEGSQGIMLDMDHGIFPNVTYANTTSKNAMEIINGLYIAPHNISTYYITRCYQTRHGNGWMSSNLPVELINNQEEINVINEWQGEFKTREIDYDLLNYALTVDRNYNRKISSEHNLVVTCMDQRPDFNFDYRKIKYPFNHIFESYSPDSKDFKQIK